MNCRLILSRITFISIILFSSGVLAAAQTEPESEVPYRVKGGVINGGAILLVTPKFPPAAVAVGARGRVNVQVVISKEGDIISAEAISGHPLLRQASVDAALASKFKTTLLAGTPVEVSGIIVYVFAGHRVFFDPLKMGFAIEYVQMTSEEPQENVFFDLSYNVPLSWNNEIQLLRALSEIFETKRQNYYRDPSAGAATVPGENSKPECESASPPTDCLGEKNQSGPPETIAFKIDDVDQSTVSNPAAGKIKIASDERVKLAPDRPKTPAEMATTLEEAFDERIHPQSEDAWYYKTGKAVGSLLADIDNDAELSGRVDSIRSLLAESSIGVPVGIIESLKRITKLHEDATLDAEARKKAIAIECLKLGT